MWETWVQSLGQEDPPEKRMSIHSSILAWRIPMDRVAWWAPLHGIASLAAQLVKNLPAMQETRFNSWVRRDRLPTPVFLGFPVWLS